MTIAKISYWEFPAPGRQVLNLQTFGSDELVSIEIPHDQYKRLLSMGLDMLIRESLFPVPLTPTQGEEHERAASGS